MLSIPIDVSLCVDYASHTTKQEYSTRLLENVVNESAFVPMRGDGLNESSTVINLTLPCLERKRVVAS